MGKAYDTKVHTLLKYLNLGDCTYSVLLAYIAHRKISAKGFFRMLPSKPLTKQFYSRNNQSLSEDKNLNRAFQIQLQDETTTNIKRLKGFLISILKQHNRLF